MVGEQGHRALAHHHTRRPLPRAHPPPHSTPAASAPRQLHFGSRSARHAPAVTVSGGPARARVRHHERASREVHVIEGSPSSRTGRCHCRWTSAASKREQAVPRGRTSCATDGRRAVSCGRASCATDGRQAVPRGRASCASCGRQAVPRGWASCASGGGQVVSCGRASCGSSGGQAVSCGRASCASGGGQAVSCRRAPCAKGIPLARDLWLAAGRRFVDS